MTLPANIRVNAQVPFPALVTGAGLITISKVNGIWQVGFSVNGIGSIVPPIGNFPTDFLIGYDSVAQSFFKVSLTNLLAIFNVSTGAARLQRLAVASPIVVAGSDQIINCNINAGAPTCALPLASSRAGVPLTFKDVGGHWAAHNLTISAADLIDGAASVVMSGDRGAITFVPANDGTSTGWSIE